MHALLSYQNIRIPPKSKGVKRERERRFSCCMFVFDLVRIFVSYSRKSKGGPATLLDSGLFFICFNKHGWQIFLDFFINPLCLDLVIVHYIIVRN